MSSAWESSLAKISVFGTSAAAGEDLGEEPVAEGLEHGADLVLGDDGAVERLGAVADLLVEFLPAQRARLPVAELGDDPRVDGAAALGDLSANPVDVEVDVDLRRRPPARALYSMTRFWLKKPNACLFGVAVSPIVKASK